MAFWVYVLKCADGSYYTGHTDNIETRLSQHQLGQSAYTSTRLPVAIIYSDMFYDRDTAFRAERRIKAWSRAKKEAMFLGDWQEVGRLAIPPSERRKRGASLDGVYPERSRWARDERDLGWGEN